MPPRKRKTKHNNKLRGYLSNFVLGILTLLVFGFLGSTIDWIFFSSGEADPNYPDLSKLLTKTKYEKKTGHKIQVEIRNGCGAPRLARMYTEFLRSEGMDVLDAKNAENFDYEETIVYHHRGERKRALELTKIMALDPSRISEDMNEYLFYDLTLILGKDYQELPSYKKAVLYQQPF